MKLLRTLASLPLVLIAGTSLADQINVHDPISGQRTVYFEQKNGYAMAEGDILIGRLDELNKPGAVMRPKVGGARWANGIIPFEISEDLPFINKLAVFQAIAHLQAHTHLEFVELNSKNRQDYQDYLYFIPAGGTTCSSYVGRQGGRQIINLAPRCNTMNSVHEIGHAIGLWHEQSRADRNQHVRIVWDNIIPEQRDNFEQQLSDGKDFGSYDYDSIMHYGPYAFTSNGMKTIIPYDESVVIGQRNHLSAGDIAAINAMYPED
ncbi:Dot/Icm T4SS effector Zinc-dependent metalloprotease LegP [Legionella sp. CNM-4043-24]|uniref:Dot/Icm T4SS effector Zinc-dependent metalloprotease LegP n=1 Tax=Legionella sp. CNM-4043-24 TaxID=3421646 RepID=UPI00403ADD37